VLPLPLLTLALAPPLLKHINKYVEREIVNQLKLRHAHIVALLEVFLTDTHLVLVMEYAAGGNLFQYVSQRCGLTERDARWFFQQLVIALHFCHRMVRRSWAKGTGRRGVGGGGGGGPRGAPDGQHKLLFLWLIPRSSVKRSPARVAGRRAHRFTAAFPPSPAAGRQQPRHQAGEHAADGGRDANHQGAVLGDTSPLSQACPAQLRPAAAHHTRAPGTIAPLTPFPAPLLAWLCRWQILG
jgi:hypothetical protein